MPIKSLSTGMRLFGLIITTLFGLAFAGVGIYLLGQLSLPTYLSWQEMRSWQPAQATILNVQSRSNDTSATYRYKINGREYQNGRVYVAEFKDNIGSYHKELSRELLRHERTGRPITIWYDPSDPQSSVIDRSMRWGLFALTTGFCLVFILIGLVVVIAAFRRTRSPVVLNMPGRAELKREWREYQADPDYDESYFDFRRRKHHELKRQQTDDAVAGGSPWLQKYEWQSNSIPSKAGAKVAMIWAFALIWCGLSAPGLFAIPEELEKGNYAILLILLFAVVGLIIVIKAVQTTLEWRRFGKLEVVLDPFPGSIGGHVGGYLDINNPKEPDAEYTVTLECVYTYVSGTGKNRSRRESISWAEQGPAHVQSLGNRLRLWFRFDVPEHLAEADIKQMGDYYFWRLTFNADIAGADLNREFNIPVFKTGELSQGVSHDISARVEAEREQQARRSQAALLEGQFHDTALARSLRYRQRHGEAWFYYPMFRNKLLTLFALIFAGFFGGAVYMMYTEFSGSGFGIFIVLFSIPFALVALSASVAAVYLPFNNLSVRIGGGRLKVLRRWFVVPIYSKTLGANDVKELIIKRSGSTGQGVDKVEHFKIEAVTHGNKKITIAEDIDGEDLANQFKDILARSLGTA